MVSDSSQPGSTPPVANGPRAVDKARIRFRKGGDLRFVSHRDLMKCFERILRRSQLPVHQTQGFHPMPRMVFAMPLSLGILGAQEVLELEFDTPVEPDEVHRRLAEQFPPGLAVLGVQRIPVKQVARVRRAGYRYAVPADQTAALPARIDQLLASPHLWIDRTRPAPRRIDARPYLSELRLLSLPEATAEPLLEMLLWVAPTGTARPDEITELLGLGALNQAGVPVERHVLELHDETLEPGPGIEPPPAVSSAPESRESAPDAERPMRPTALMAGPLSFDS